MAMPEWAGNFGRSAIGLYNRFALMCANHGDSVAKKLFEGLVMDVARHYGHRASPVNADQDVRPIVPPDPVFWGSRAKGVRWEYAQTRC